MIGLDDPKWRTFNGGYRMQYDASTRLRELNADANVADDVWQELWEELHHQGDVDIASYASVPHLVKICKQHCLLDWNLFALVATIESCRLFGRNPQLPEWLESDYPASIKELALFGAQHFAEDWSTELTQSFLAVAAFAKGCSKTGKVLITFLGEDELDEA